MFDDDVIFDAMIDAYHPALSPFYHPCRTRDGRPYVGVTTFDLDDVRRRVSRVAPQIVVGHCAPTAPAPRAEVHAGT